MKTIQITRNDAGQRLDKFLSKAFPALPSSLLYKYIRKKRVKLNGKRAQISSRLEENDLLSLYISDELLASRPVVYDFMKASKSLKIVYEDTQILLVDKPPGVLVHPDEKEYCDTLIGRILRYLYEKGEYRPEQEQSFVPALINRIDRNTGGLVIAAKSADALRVLNKKMQQREIQKYYLCILQGTPAQKSGLLDGYLEKNEQKNKVRVSDAPGNNRRSIRTQYRVLKEKNGLSLVEVELLTGRTHQIRAHFASIGHPLLGDIKYGESLSSKFSERRHQALYSYKLTFEFESPAEPLDYLNGRSFHVDHVWFTELLDYDYRETIR